MEEIIIITTCVVFFLRMIWTFVISNFFYSEKLVYGVIIFESIVNIILFFFAIDKWSSVFLVGLVMFGAFDFLAQSGCLEFRETIIEWYEERRLKIELWQDMLIDIELVMFVIQIMLILID